MHKNSLVLLKKLLSAGSSAFRLLASIGWGILAPNPHQKSLLLKIPGCANDLP